MKLVFHTFTRAKHLALEKEQQLLVITNPLFTCEEAHSLPVVRAMTSISEAQHQGHRPPLKGHTTSMWHQLNLIIKDTSHMRKGHKELATPTKIFTKDTQTPRRRSQTTNGTCETLHQEPASLAKAHTTSKRTDSLSTASNERNRDNNKPTTPKVSLSCENRAQAVRALQVARSSRR